MTRSLLVSCHLVTLSLIACGADSTNRQPAGVITVGVAGDTVGELAHQDIGRDPVKVVPTVVYSNDSLTLIWKVAQLGQFLVVAQPYESPHLLVIDTVDGSLRATIGRDGEGPGEFKWPGGIAVADATGDRIWVSDPALRRFTPLRLVTGQVVVDSAGIIKPELGARMFGGTPWRDDRFLVADTDGNAQFLVVDRTGQVVGALGSSEYADTTVPRPIYHAANEQVLAVDFDSSRIVAVGLLNGRITIYDSAGAVLREVDTPYRLSPYYRIGQARSGGPSMQPQPHTRYGYIGVSVSRQYIFALFSGRTIKGHQSGASAGRFIHVYSWDGALVAVLELAEAVGALTVTKDGRTLYATGWEPAPAVLRIRLPRFE